MKKNKIIYFVILVLLSASCSENKGFVDIQSQEIIIPFQETKFMGSEKTSITFSKILEDARCPENSNINCIWEGRILVEITVNNLEKFTIGLGNLQSNSQELFTNSFEYEGYLIKLMDVNPKRTTIQQPQSSHHQIILNIKKI
jgi:hypothetical protein